MLKKLHSQAASRRLGGRGSPKYQMLRFSSRMCQILIWTYPSYETIAAQNGYYPFVDVYEVLSADMYQLLMPVTVSR